MPEFGPNATDEEPLYAKLHCSFERVEEILTQLGDSGLPLPDRFSRPKGLTEPDHQDILPASEFSIRKQWAGVVREIQDALNSAASDVHVYEAFTKKAGHRARDLNVLRNASSTILTRLARSSSKDCESSELVLFEEISANFGPFAGDSDLDGFVVLLDRFSSVISQMQSDDNVKAKERLALLYSRDLEAQRDQPKRLTPQEYLIRRYTMVFENLFRLVPEQYTARNYNNFNGPYPDFIAAVMRIHTGKAMTPAALTKALQRAGFNKPKT